MKHNYSMPDLDIYTCIHACPPGCHFVITDPCLIFYPYKLLLKMETITLTFTR